MGNANSAQDIDGILSPLHPECTGFIAPAWTECDLKVRIWKVNLLPKSGLLVAGSPTILFLQSRQSQPLPQPLPLYSKCI